MFSSLVCNATLVDYKRICNVLLFSYPQICCINLSHARQLSIHCVISQQ